MEKSMATRAAAVALAGALAAGLGGAISLASPSTADAKGAVKPAKVKIESVKVSKAGKMTVKVAKAKRAKKYQYRVWGAGMRTKTVKTKKRSVSVSVEKAKKTVKVKVRAYNGWKHGKWSSTKTVKVAKAKDVHRWRTETVHKDATWWEKSLLENGFFDRSFASGKERMAVRLIPDPDSWDGAIYESFIKAVPQGYHINFNLNCMVEDEPAYDATYRVCDECGKRELVKKKVHKHHWVSRTVHHDEKTVSGDIVWYYVYKNPNDAQPAFKTTSEVGAQNLVYGNKEEDKIPGWENAGYRKAIVHEDDHVVCPSYDETYQICSGCGAERVQSGSGKWYAVRPGMHQRISEDSVYTNKYGYTLKTY